MWARCSVLLIVAACYSPTAVTGTPCTPGADNCPRGQHCALVGGEHVCVSELPPADADAPADAAITPDTPDGATPRWSLVQTRGRMGNDTPITATTAGTLLVVAVETSDTEPVTEVTDNGGNTYVRVPGSRAIDDREDFGVELWYAKAAQAGATRVAATGATIYAIVMWEVAGLDPTDPLGGVAKVDDQAPSTTPTGAAITTTTPGEFVVSVAIVATTVAGIHAGNAFTNDHVTFGNGWAHLTDDAAPPGTYQAQWDHNSNGESCTTSAAFRVRP